MRKTDVSNSADIIDSRDVIARIEELQDGRQSLVDALEQAQALVDDCEDDSQLEALQDAHVEAQADLDAWDEEEDAQELAALLKLAEDGESVDDWEHGAALIRESYFTDYCQELVEDIGDLPRGMPHYIVVDWEATARNLRTDYTELDYCGVTYLVR